MLAHWNNSPRIDMSPHSDTLAWFRANQSLFFLLNAECLEEKQQIPILVFGLTQSGREPTIYHTRGEHANHYTTNAVEILLKAALNTITLTPYMTYLIYLSHIIRESVYDSTTGVSVKEPAIKIFTFLIIFHSLHQFKTVFFLKKWK